MNLEKFKCYFEQGPVGMAVISVQKSWMEVNQRLCSILGRSSQELLGLKWRDLTHPQDMEEEESLLEQVITGESDGFSLDKRFFNSEGRIVHVAMMIRCVRDKDDAIDYLAAVVRDISERKRIEEALRMHRDNLDRLVESRTLDLASANQKLMIENQQRLQTERRLRASQAQKAAILESMADRVTYFESPALHVVWVNRSDKLTERTTCYQEFLGQTQPCDACPVLRAFESSRTQELEINDRDGRTWLIKANPIRDREGLVSGVVEVCQDISAHKQAEEERRKLDARVLHAQKLESLGVLAGGIAHDFNNYLMGILGNASLALDEIDTHSEAGESLLEIERTARKAAEVCRQMLAFSGRGRFEVRSLFINSTIEEMTHLLRLTSKHIAIDLHDNVPAIEADESQIRQVIMSVVSNAAEAIGDEHGSISIITKPFDGGQTPFFDTEAQTQINFGLYALLEIQDTGDGMRPEDKQRMFEPFFSTKFIGRGLGLAALLGIVRAHKGAVNVDSKQGVGTRVRIILPALDKNVEALCRTEMLKSINFGAGK